MGLRFDGLYIKSDDQFASVIRFIPGGTVLTVSVGHEGSNADLPVGRIASWMKPDHPGLSKGEVALNGANVEFSSTSSEGTVSYHGTINMGGTELRLRTHSAINGHRGDGIWSFIEVEESPPEHDAAEASSRLRPLRDQLLDQSARLSAPGFAGLVDLYIDSRAAILKAGDGDLYTVGQPDDYFKKSAFVLTSQKLWAFRGAGIFGAKKPASIELREIDRVAVTRVAAITGNDEVGITLRQGACTLKGGPTQFTTSLVARWQLKVKAAESWAEAISRACAG